MNPVFFTHGNEQAVIAFSRAFHFFGSRACALASFSMLILSKAAAISREVKSSVNKRSNPGNMFF